MTYTAVLTHPTGRFIGDGATDHDAVQAAYKALQAAWSIDPWTARVAVYQGSDLCYVHRSVSAYEVSIR